MSLQEELETLKAENVLMYQFVIEKSITNSNQKALQAINRTESWLSKYADRVYLNDLSDRLRADNVTSALELLKSAAYKAVKQLIADLDNRDPKVRQTAYRDLLDRVGVRVPDRQQLEIVAPAAVRVLEDVLMQVYGGETGGDDRLRLSSGDDQYIDGTIIDDIDDQYIDGEIIDVVTDVDTRVDDTPVDTDNNKESG